MTSEVEERPRLVTGGYGQHRGQWVKKEKFYYHLSLELTTPEGVLHIMWSLRGGPNRKEGVLVVPVRGYLLGGSASKKSTAGVFAVMS